MSGASYRNVYDRDNSKFSDSLQSSFHVHSQLFYFVLPSSILFRVSIQRDAQGTRAAASLKVRAALSQRPPQAVRAARKVIQVTRICYVTRCNTEASRPSFVHGESSLFREDAALYIRRLAGNKTPSANHHLVALLSLSDLFLRTATDCFLSFGLYGINFD